MRAMGNVEGMAWRGGRGPRRWSFTAKDVATATGLTPAQVRRLANAKDGGFDPSDPVSLAAFVTERRGEAAALAARAVVAAAKGGVEAGAAVLGLSRSALYRLTSKAEP